MVVGGQPLDHAHQVGERRLPGHLQQERAVGAGDLDGAADRAGRLRHGWDADEPAVHHDADGAGRRQQPVEDQAVASWPERAGGEPADHGHAGRLGLQRSQHRVHVGGERIGQQQHHRVALEPGDRLHERMGGVVPVQVHRQRRRMVPGEPAGEHREARRPHDRPGPTHHACGGRTEQHARSKQGPNRGNDVLEHSGVRRGGEQHHEVRLAVQALEHPAADLADRLRRHGVRGEGRSEGHPTGGSRVRGTTCQGPCPMRQRASASPYSSNSNSARTSR
jgi:hypothetical protein